MATTKQSIAGRAHGAKPAAPAAQTKRYRPQLEGLPGVHHEVSRAIQTAFDNLYSLRDDIQRMQAAAKVTSTASPGGAGTGGTGSGGSGASAESGKAGNGFNDNIQGIKVKAPTDASSLKNGMVPTYNAKTGQFEFLLP